MFFELGCFEVGRGKQKWHSARVILREVITTEMLARDEWRYLDTKEIIPPEKDNRNASKDDTEDDYIPLNKMPAEVTSRLTDDLHTSIMPIM